MAQRYLQQGAQINVRYLLLLLAAYFLLNDRRFVIQTTQPPTYCCLAETAGTQWKHLKLAMLSFCDASTFAGSYDSWLPFSCTAPVCTEPTLPTL